LGNKDVCGCVGTKERTKRQRAHAQERERAHAHEWGKECASAHENERERGGREREREIVGAKRHGERGGEGQKGREGGRGRERKRERKRRLFFPADSRSLSHLSLSPSLSRASARAYALIDLLHTIRAHRCHMGYHILSTQPM